MKSLKLRLLVMALLIVSAAAVFAQEKDPADTKIPQQKMGPGMMAGRLNMMKNLNLTDDQKAKISQLKMDMEKEAIKTNSEIKLNKVELKKIMAEKELNTGKMATILNNNAKLELKLKEMRIDHSIKVYNILDAKQREIWKKQFMIRGIMNKAGERGFNRPMMRQGMHAGMRGQAMMRQGMRMGMQGKDMMRPGMGRRVQPNIEKEVVIEKN